ncbi:HupE/UreJ family protein [Aliamphritea spongicola]|uniref:HupE/UreJ family protein n=1 Tax=Aliamphritea spongicola TaxID=707589 RepID=UPI00196B5190|nr:HupE/UreJ family protein [Aliamphritea spongicola]MBN3563038.1 HupE/UreJ family protein [Aliamphritea spongicola]
MKKVHYLYLSLLGLFLPNIVLAHQATQVNGFISGLSHPVLGFDHLLAMISVGILSAQIGGRAIWTVPATFVVVMLIGGILGMQGVPFISVELGIAASVLALGVALAAAKKMPQGLAMVFVGFFALFHGHAHGTEMPQLAQAELYALGFVLGTAGIHIAGVLVGGSSRFVPHGVQLLRYIGAGIAGIGFYLVAV